MFKLLKFSWKMGFVLALMFGLLTNLLLLTSSVAFSTASAAVSAATGLSTVARRTAADLAVEKAAKRAARSELSEKAEEVVFQKSLLRSLRGEIADPLTRKVTYRGQRVAVREVVNTAVSRISRRTVLTSAREVSGMAAEAMPFVGTAAIAGFTALELRDLCETMKDMADLQQALDPAATENTDRKKVCGIRPPSKEEIWAKVKNSPHEVWTSARAALPDLTSIRDYQVPEYDWAAMSSSSIAKTKHAWSGMVGGATKAGKATSDAAKRLLQGTRNLIWSGQDAENEPD